MNSKETICTWLYAESVGQESEYPNVGGVSSSIEFQQVYWKCLVVFFSTSLRYNPSAKHILFTNVATIPHIDDFDVAGYLESLNVLVVYLELTFRTPEEYYNKFGNQFYIFDILNYLSASGDDGYYFILDSDIVWLHSAEDMVAAIDEFGLLTMQLDYSEDYNINGLSRKDLRQLFNTLDSDDRSDIPEYYGGEFFACSGRELKRIVNEIPRVWEFSMSQFNLGLPKFNEEAHLLSYIYYRLQFKSGTANRFVKRIWTLRSRNVDCADIDLALWHVPAEKKYGLNRLYSVVVKPNSRFWTTPAGPELVRYIGSFLSVPKVNLKYLFFTIRDKIFEIS